MDDGRIKLNGQGYVFSRERRIYFIFQVENPPEGEIIGYNP